MIVTREDNPLSDQESTSLVFEDIRFEVGRGSKTKTILHRVGAVVQEGHVLAIMGPSGAGKTTLISILTQDAHYGRAYGKVMLNNKKMSTAMFKRYSYVMHQNDSNWPYLTVREILTFALELYNSSANHKQLLQTVDQVLTKVGLHGAADTRSINLSGGQQRRLSLAVALLKQPKVLFLDEPTSGLDAASAAAIMRELTAVARQERLIIVCTIHQPSSKVFNDFDQVMLLSKGREAYVGSASTSIEYFASIGYTLPQATNGAEHLLDIVNADFSTDAEVDAVLGTWAKRRSPIDVSSQRALLPTLGSPKKDLGILQETFIMFRRIVRLLSRDPILYVGRIFGFLLVNCVFGVVYIAAREYAQDQAANKLWVSAWYIGVPANMAVINTYKTNLELRTIFREHKNGMGSVASYLIAKTILTVPIMFVFSVAALGIPAFIIQDYPLSTIPHFIFLWTAQIFVWEASSEAMAAMFDEVVLGMLVHTAWWFASLLFSGYLVPLQDIFYYILPYNYFVRSAVYLVFTNHEWEPCTDLFSSAVCVDSTDGRDVLAALEPLFRLVDTESTYVTDLLCLLGIAITWKVIGTVIILYKAQKVALVREPEAGLTETKDLVLPVQTDTHRAQQPEEGGFEERILFSSAKSHLAHQLHYDDITDVVVEA